MKLYKIALSAFAGALAGEVIGPHIKEGYNWVRRKLDLPEIAGAVRDKGFEYYKALGALGKPEATEPEPPKDEPPTDIN